MDELSASTPVNFYEVLSVRFWIVACTIQAGTPTHDAVIQAIEADTIAHGRCQDAAGIGADDAMTAAYRDVDNTRIR